MTPKTDSTPSLDLDGREHNFKNNEQENHNNKEIGQKEVSSQTLGRIVKYDMGRNNILMRFRLYEGHIESSLYRALKELQKQQLLRSKVWQNSGSDKTEVF